jgi:hypothetical protein
MPPQSPGDPLLTTNNDKFVEEAAAHHSSQWYNIAGITI